MEVLLGQRPVGDGQPCFVLAEIGINHNGSIDVAHELIRQARIAGAAIAKFQFYDPY